MILLAFSLVGMTFVWSLETTYGTPYLLQLGLSKSKTSFVWLAGPASGMIMQPIIGAITDRSTNRFGRRRPAMLMSAVATGAAVIMLGWTSEFVGLFVDSGTTKHQNSTIVVAVLSIYALDFAINVVQACGRSLIVDVLPIPKQQLGTAWAARMGATGHILAYMIGQLDLVSFTPSWLGGDSQFKKMTVLSTTFLLAAVSITSYAVTERVLVRPGGDANASVVGVFFDLWYQTFHLPRRISQICWVQFWSWIGWFPVLFYGSTWVGETYFRYDDPAAAEGDPQEVLGRIGRLGSTAFVIFSVVNLASAYFIPLFVEPPDRRSQEARLSNKTPSSTFSRFKATLLPLLAPYQPGLITTWMLSNTFFAIICFISPFVRSLAGATTIIALAGIPWAVTVWAPFAEMGVEINRLDPAGTIGSSNAFHQATGASATASRAGGYAAVRTHLDDHDETEDNAIEMEEAREQYDQSRPQSTRTISESHTPSQSNRHTRSLSAGKRRTSNSSQDDQDDTTGELAGIYLGVLNIYSTLPQFIGSAINWIVFLLFEPKRSAVDTEGPDIGLQKDGPNAIAICLFIGALCSCVAAEAGRRLKRIP